MQWAGRGALRCYGSSGMQHRGAGAGCSVLIDLQAAARLPAVQRLRTWQRRVVECRGRWLMFMRRFMLAGVRSRVT